MTQHWTFGQKLALGFSVMAALAIAMSVVAAYALSDVVAAKDRVITVNAQMLLHAEEMSGAADRRSAAIRGYLLTPREELLEQIREANTELVAITAKLRPQLTTEEGRRLLEACERSADEHRRKIEALVQQRKTDTPLETVVALFDRDVRTAREKMAADIRAFLAQEERLLDEAIRDSSRKAQDAAELVIGLAAAITVIAVLLAVFLVRTLGRQVGFAVAQVQSSSAELQAAASQQATGSREQSTAMNEISTTISELLVTSRQIAESAQRVAKIAEETSRSARSGESAVQRATESVGAIRRQVDQIVGHMLELGKKSQQIGAVLEIVYELAEQTNILAINATIEAAGAGDAGKRFGVVADEIRKLADRVTGSTKEIRVLIEDVRSAVNTTVMATETGSKAVDAGAKQFSELAAAFGQISGSVSTSTDAAREIELSTKQQATAVEQVKIAIGNVAQAAVETEASSAQTLATAGQLASLSSDLSRLVQARAQS